MLVARLVTSHEMKKDSKIIDQKRRVFNIPLTFSDKTLGRKKIGIKSEFQQFGPPTILSLMLKLKSLQIEV